jgi:hypothetical protein
MDKKLVSDRDDGELVERGLRELTNDETAFVGGGFPWLIAVGIYLLAAMVVGAIASEVAAKK